MIYNTVRELAAEYDHPWIRVSSGACANLGRQLEADGQRPIPLAIPIVNGRPIGVGEVITYELVANAVNFCYWYGRGDYRPKGCSSDVMYQCLSQVWADDQAFHGWPAPLIRLLAVRRFPLLAERERMLQSLVSTSPSVHRLAKAIVDGESLHLCLELMVESFTCYASDQFLKRATLFFLQLHRRTGMFEKDIKSLIPPIDYRIPHALHDLGCLVYADPLVEIIDRHDLIAAGSHLEVGIRAAAAVACQMILAEMPTHGMPKLDSYLWNHSRSLDTPFHLTVTTDY